jgi:hypothetical protein
MVLSGSILVVKVGWGLYKGENQAIGDMHIMACMVRLTSEHITGE